MKIQAVMDDARKQIRPVLSPAQRRSLMTQQPRRMLQTSRKQGSFVRIRKATNPNSRGASRLVGRPHSPPHCFWIETIAGENRTRPGFSPTGISKSLFCLGQIDGALSRNSSNQPLAGCSSFMRACAFFGWRYFEGDGDYRCAGQLQDRQREVDSRAGCCECEVTLPAWAAGSRARCIARVGDRRRMLGIAIQDGSRGWACESRYPCAVEPVRVVVDPKSALFVSGSELDFSDDLQKGGFKVSNPNAVAHCSCGESFSACGPAARLSYFLGSKRWRMRFRYLVWSAGR